MTPLEREQLAKYYLLFEGWLTPSQEIMKSEYCGEYASHKILSNSVQITQVDLVMHDQGGVRNPAMTKSTTAVTHDGLLVIVRHKDESRLPAFVL